MHCVRLVELPVGHKLVLNWLLLGCFLIQSIALAQSEKKHAEHKQEHAEAQLPIVDVQVHYSLDSAKLTPPQRVIEIMREAGLKFALVSSTDNKDTQLLSKLAPDLIVPGLRPYRGREESDTWFTELDVLEYVEGQLEKNRYATIGKFKLSGEAADYAIPTQIVHLADKHNLILHVHSDGNALNRILAQSSNVKVLWAHAGFESPKDIGKMLDTHNRLWADLGFRTDIGNGGTHC